jgi:hypothetical protein
MGEISMSVVPVDGPYGFWRRLADVLDARFAGRSQRVVPEAALRRSRREVARCRRLMHRAYAGVAEGNPGAFRAS